MYLSKLFQNDSFFNDNYFSTSNVNYEQWTDENGYQLRIDAPGIKKEDLSIFVENNYLDVSWKRYKENDPENKKYGEKKISFKLPETIKVENISSNLENGVIKIALPKTEPEKPKRIPILIE